MNITSIDQIHPSDWRRVARKSAVKTLVRAIEDAGLPISSIYVSPAFGSVYIDIGVGEYDADYECYDSTVTVRVSSHERVSAEHGQPDVNVFENGQVNDAIREIEGLAA